LTDYVTVSAKITVQLRKKMAELDIKPSEVIKIALEKEVEERTRKMLYEKVEKASQIMSKVRREMWVKAIRESRNEK